MCIRDSSFINRQTFLPFKIDSTLVDEFKDPTHFPCDIFLGAWDHYMTYDMKTLQVYETQSSDYLENVTKEHPSKTLKYFESNLPEKSYVLDYGCGPGLCAEYLANLGHNVTAFDASQNMIQLVPKHKLSLIHI